MMEFAWKLHLNPVDFRKKDFARCASLMLNVTEMRGKCTEVVAMSVNKFDIPVKFR